MVISGTSASAPIFASMVALVNDRLAGAGKPPLGFLNPLYVQRYFSLRPLLMTVRQPVFEPRYIQ